MDATSATETLSGEDVARWLTEQGDLLVVCSGSVRLTAGALLEVELPDGVLVIARASTRRTDTTLEA